jgi:hypothetical protein|tara:strand:- start:255 stop:443 length:189 start_codon:yes stop_codon:yes gene_type:complete
MGNTCGCVDQAEKDGEVKVESNKLTTQNNHRQAQINNYRDSTVSNAKGGGQYIPDGPVHDGT